MDIFVVATKSFFTFFITLFCIKILIYFAPQLKLLDHPLGRKKHQKSTPLVGGIGVFLGLTSSFYLAFKNYSFFGIFWLCALLILIIGIMDDRHDIKIKTRLALHSFVFLVCVFFGGVQLENFGAIFTSTPLYLGSFAPAITIFIMLTYIYAINMLDGVDGLAGSLIVIQACFLLGFSLVLHESMIAFLLINFLCSVMGFLFFNFPFFANRQASVFLGDAGSTFLAFFIAWIAIYLSQKAPLHSIHPMQIFWCVYYPFLEICATFTLRKYKKQPVTKAGNDHLHFMLLQKSFSKKMVILFMCGLSIAYSVLGILMDRLNVSENLQFLMMWVNLFIYIKFIIKLAKIDNDEISSLHILE